MTEERDRLIGRKGDERITGSVFHWFGDCIRWPKDKPKAVTLDDQTIDLLNLKLCADCKRRADTDPAQAIFAAICDAVPELADIGLTSSQIDEFLRSLDGQGFEIRPKRKAPKKSKS